MLAALTAGSQFVYAVPWPYFFAVLSVAIGAGIWSINQLQLSRIDNKVTLAPSGIDQFPKDGKFAYRIKYSLTSISRSVIYYKVTQNSWEIGERSKEAVNIDESIGVITIGDTSTYGPTIEGLSSAPLTGKFKILAEFRRDPDDMEYEFCVIGSFKLQYLSDEPVPMSVPFGYRASTNTIRKL